MGSWDADVALKGWIDVEDVTQQIAKLKADVLERHAPGLVIAERLAGQVAELRSQIATMRTTITGLHAEVTDLKAEVAKLRLGVPADLGAPGTTPEPPVRPARKLYTREQRTAVIEAIWDADATLKGRATSCVVCGVDISGRRHGRGGRRYICGQHDCRLTYDAARQFERYVPKRTRKPVTVVAGVGVREPSKGKAR